jgi:hypothetical protein
MQTTDTTEQAVRAAFAAIKEAKALIGEARYALEMDDRDAEAQAAMDAIDHLTSAGFCMGGTR